MMNRINSTFVVKKLNVMKKLFLLLITATSILSSQSVGLNLKLAFPSGEFKQHLNSVGFGGSVDVTFWSPSKELPFSFGVEMSYLIYGYESSVEPFSSVYSNISVDVTRKNNILKLHTLFKIDPFKGDIKPYAELLFGGSYLWTNTEVSTWSDEEIGSEVDFYDFAWSYGGGAGLLYKLLDSIDEPAVNSANLYLDCKIRYMRGTEAEYLKSGSIKVTTNGIEYEVSKSKTDLISFHFGVLLTFSAVTP